MRLQNMTYSKYRERLLQVEGILITGAWINTHVFFSLGLHIHCIPPEM